MTKDQANSLEFGLYLIQWKDGGTSLASVGQLHNGDRWLAPCNWSSKDEVGLASPHHWDRVANALCIISQSQKVELDKGCLHRFRLTVEMIEPIVVVTGAGDERSN